MAGVYTISDLHFGHKNMINFSPKYRQGVDVDAHDEWLIDSCNSVVGKRDVLYILGDIAFTKEGLEKIGRLNGMKKLILGNHDKYPIEQYLKYGKVLPGIVKYKEMWLSHAPIHPRELRGFPNIHGHVHVKSVPDKRYINVCVEALRGKPISLEALKERIKKDTMFTPKTDSDDRVIYER